MSQVLPDDVPSLPLDVRVRRQADGLLVAGSAQALELTDTARDIWLRIDGVASISHIARAVAVSYDADPDAVVEDVQEFVADLVEHGLVRLRPGGSA